jgi:hypothetical protein
MMIAALAGELARERRAHQLGKTLQRRVPIGNLIRLQLRQNRAMLLSYERSLQPSLVRQIGAISLIVVMRLDTLKLASHCFHT